jgi:hypothetical protein
MAKRLTIGVGDIRFGEEITLWEVMRATLRANPKIATGAHLAKAS